LSSTDAPAPAPAPTPVDERRAALLEALTTDLGDAVVGSEVRRGDIWVRVRADAWKRAVGLCRESLGFDYFCFLSGIDWLPHTWPNPKVEGGAGVEVADDADSEADVGPPEAEAGFEAEDTPPDPADDGLRTGYAGGDTRFQVMARLYSTVRHLGVTLKADLDDDDPRVESVADVYPGADWCERETWEMYGFAFEGHPNLVHLYLPGEFEGFPLRKDFPLLSREVKPWPGLVDVEPMPEAPDAPANGDGAA
jgi:NADH-quinone oxidoreductase subunit C